MNHNKRRTVNHSASHKAFKGRARKTHRMNTAAPLRGGIRL